MDDKQLLEMAAKAAGMSGTCVDYDDRLVFLEDGKPASVEWNPLTDDGDALRLAVKLGMGLHYESQFFSDRVERIVEVYHSHEDDKCQCVTEGYTDDPLAATRRAITRAAASIGKER